jgi:ribosomal protein S14
MECGDPKQAGVEARFCPRCEVRAFQQYQWRPDQAPTRHRRRCHHCGWDSGWVPYDEWIVLSRGAVPVGEKLAYSTAGSIINRWPRVAPMPGG